MSENNWGVNTNKQNDKMENTWGKSVNSYGAGFATVLKVFVAINSFIIPLIIWGIIAGTLAEQTDGASVILALIGYPLTAFVLWVTSSYLVKLFDNISKMAQNTEAILLQLQDKRNDNSVETK